MDTENEFPNDNDLVNPEDPYSPTEKEVREYVQMGYSRSGAISSLTTTKKNREEQDDLADDGLDGTDEMVRVSRLDNYYSRNGLKTNLDDDEE